MAYNPNYKGIQCPISGMDNYNSKQVTFFCALVGLFDLSVDKCYGVGYTMMINCYLLTDLQATLPASTQINLMQLSQR